MNRFLLSIAFGAAALTASAQGTLQEYQRAYAVRTLYSSDSVMHWAHDIAWKDSTHLLHYRIATPQGRRYVVYDADSGAQTTYTTLEEMNKALHIAPAPKRPPVYGRHHQPHWMEVDEEKDVYPCVSPDGKQAAYIEGCNVVVQAAGNPSAPKRVLTQDGTEGNYYSNRILWSPDGRYIFVCKRIPVDKRYVYYVESSPSDQLQPILHKQEYAKPGDQLPQHLPVIIEVATGRRVEADAHAVENQYELGSFAWSPDSREVTMEYNKRGHQLYQLLAMNAAWRRSPTRLSTTPASGGSSSTAANSSSGPASGITGIISTSTT